MTNHWDCRSGPPIWWRPASAAAPVTRRSVLDGVRRPRARGRPVPRPQSARAGAHRFRRARRRPGAAGRGGRLLPPRRAGPRRGARRHGPHGRRRRAGHDRGARALGSRGRRRPAQRAAQQARPVPRRRARTLVPDSVAALAGLRAAPGLPPTASSCCATSAAAAPASRWPTPAPGWPSSATPCGTRNSPATSSTRRCSTTSSPVSPRPTPPIRRAPPPSGR